MILYEDQIKLLLKRDRLQLIFLLAHKVILLSTLWPNLIGLIGHEETDLWFQAVGLSRFRRCRWWDRCWGWRWCWFRSRCNFQTQTHTSTHHTHLLSAQRGPKLGADPPPPPPAVREMPVSPAALQRRGGRKEGKEPGGGRKGKRGGEGAREGERRDRDAQGREEGGRNHQEICCVWCQEGKKKRAKKEAAAYERLQWCLWVAFRHLCVFIFRGKWIQTKDKKMHILCKAIYPTPGVMFAPCMSLPLPCHYLTFYSPAARSCSDSAPSLPPSVHPCV